MIRVALEFGLLVHEIASAYLVRARRVPQEAPAHQPGSQRSGAAPAPTGIKLASGLPMTQSKRSQESDHSELAAVVGDNIRAMLDARAAFESRKTAQERAADRITAFTGSLPFVYVHAAILAGWMAMNSHAIGSLHPWDPPPFAFLAMLASVEAIFLSTFVLISQNRMQRLADKRADLDLQVNLLAEREITRVLQTVDAIAKRVGAETPSANDLHVLKQDVGPEQVLREIERAEAEEEKVDRPSRVNR